MPTASARPPSDMMFSDRSDMYISMNVPTTETGMATLVMNVVRGVAQEQVKNNDRQQAAEHGGEFHFADRGTDEVRLVVDGDDLGLCRERLLDLFQFLAHAGRELHRIRVAFLVDGQLDALACR